MAYFKDRETAMAESAAWPSIQEICICCGELTYGPLIAYDLYQPGTRSLTRFLIHRDCAFAMAQRITCDAWPNRHDGELMTNGR